jgi:proton-dependent oligopeptide transporter, POT family
MSPQATSPAPAPVAVTRPHDRRFFGHPRGLATLFFTEMWERFSYYGMRAILTLFMITAADAGGLGFSTTHAAIVYGLYTSLAYLLPLAGGWLADHFLGMRRAVLLGGIVIMLGHVLLAMHGIGFFYAGLASVVLGTGLLKPNMSAIVGQLYDGKDARRDAGFSIFYMGINLGAFLSPLVCGWLAQSEAFRGMLERMGVDPRNSWHWGFGAAAVGMFFGLVQYVATGRYLGEAGVRPGAATSAEARARSRRKLAIGSLVIGGVAALLVALALANPEAVTKEKINQVYSYLLLATVVGFFAWLLSSKGWSGTVSALFAGSCVFWSVFEQAGSTLTLFAEEKTRNSVLGWTFPSSWWQSVNAVLIVILAPVFAWLWARLGNFDRSSMIRFSIGILLVGLGFALLIGGANEAGASGRASPLWLFGVYLLHTVGELCLSPVGLSSMTRLSPQRVQGLMLGVWYLSISVGTFLGSKVAGVYTDFALPTLFGTVAAGAVLVALLMAILIRPVSKLVDARS